MVVSPLGTLMTNRVQRLQNSRCLGLKYCFQCWNHASSWRVTVNWFKFPERYPPCLLTLPSLSPSFFENVATIGWICNSYQRIYSNNEILIHCVRFSYIAPFVCTLYFITCITMSCFQETLLYVSIFKIYFSSLPGRLRLLTLVKSLQWLSHLWMGLNLSLVIDIHTLHSFIFRWHSYYVFHFKIHLVLSNRRYKWRHLMKGNIMCQCVFASAAGIIPPLRRWPLLSLLYLPRWWWWWCDQLF